MRKTEASIGTPRWQIRGIPALLLIVVPWSVGVGQLTAWLFQGVTS